MVLGSVTSVQGEEREGKNTSSEHKTRRGLERLGTIRIVHETGKKKR